MSSLSIPAPRGYRVRIVADSIGHNKCRMTTWILRYPRFVHAELMTHRLFSRNAASSRAIPTKKLMEQIRREPAMPIWWGKNQSGMQSREELIGWRLAIVKNVWLWARWGALLTAWLLTRLGFHKQIANRVLEPWMFIEVLVSATEYENWFRLRCHPDAQPEIGWVAKEMKRQYDLNVPRCLSPGKWHRPLIQFDDELVDVDLNKVSAGRCARISFLTHDGRRDISEDVGLAGRLMTSGHWSPFEHIAQAQAEDICEWSGNLRGWTQYRATIDPTFTVVGGRS